ncbi:MAG: phosphodiester glycosidase family protein [Chitinispirillales bacterium]|jgi:hypothetical protein|nr:phosphodiester glycosidase family protein [Chitinispirillales bacterium]
MVNMKKHMSTLQNIFSLTALLFALTTSAAAQWRQLEPGLELGKFNSPLYPPADSTKIHILRIDPKLYELRLLNASHPDQGRSLTALDWGRKEKLSAVINAAMYQTDYLSSVSLMRTSQHVNNSYVSKDKTILVFEPLRKNIPPVRIVDLQCDDFESIRPLYGSMVQSIRMISCAGKNVWQENGKRWSIAAAGTDKQDNILFIQTTAPHSVHEFVNILNSLPISIDRAMYMEGGSPSQLYIGTPSDTLQFIGNFSTGGRSMAAPVLPNVLGVKKR